jgi:folylpolyglutamate synthase
MIADHISHGTDSAEVASLSLQKAFAEKWHELDPSANIQVLLSLEDAFEYARDVGGTELAFEYLDEMRGRQPTNDLELGKVHVLVTGSVHLVGRALGELEGADAL